MPLISRNAYQPYIKSGDMKYCCSLQAPTVVRTPTGASKTTWSEIDPAVWVQKIELRGVQLYYAQSFAPEATAILRTRFRTDIDAGMILQDNMWTYTVMRPPVDLEGAQAVILCYVRQLRVVSPLNTQ